MKVWISAVLVMFLSVSAWGERITWTNERYGGFSVLHIGQLGPGVGAQDSKSGELTIGRDAHVNVESGTMSVGNVNNTGILNVNGGSLTSGAQGTIGNGDNGTAALSITNGGKLSVASQHILFGNASGAVATGVVSGSKNLLSAKGADNVVGLGSLGGATGELTASHGATLDANRVLVGHKGTDATSVAARKRG